MNLKIQNVSLSIQGNSGLFHQVSLIPLYLLLLLEESVLVLALILLRDMQNQREEEGQEKPMKIQMI